MSDQNRITLDSPAFAGNLRDPLARSDRPVKRPVSRAMNDVVMYKRTVPVYGSHMRPHAQPQHQQPAVVVPQPFSYGSVVSEQASSPRPLHTPQAQPTQYSQQLPQRAQPPAQKPLLTKPAKKHKKLGFKRLKLNSSSAFKMAAFGFMLVGSLILFRYYRATQQIVNAQALHSDAAPVSDTTQTAADVPPESDGAVKSEKPPVSNYKYSVPAANAKKITIPAIGVNAFVRDVGMTKDGAMATPSNIYWLGWSTQGVLPGESGLAIVNGHVSGPTATGVFYKLNKLNAGDIVKVEKGDGTTVSYKVVAKESVAATDAATKLYQMRGKAASQLNMITCDGKFDSKSDSYKNRLIVYTEKV